MDAFVAIMLFIVPWLFYMAFVFLLILFPLWMLVHSIIRTVKMWPNEKEMNLIMVLLIFVTGPIGAIVYYFVCYKKSAVMATPKPHDCQKTIG